MLSRDSQQQLIQCLLQQLEHFSRYDHRQIIEIKFQQSLFRESCQPLQGYLDEIRQNIEKLSPLTDIEPIRYLAEKITTQFKVLFDAIKPLQAPPAPIPAKKRRFAEQQRKYAVFHLPPEQRIHQYYAYLTRFNDYIAALEHQLQQTTDYQQKQQLQQQVAQYQQRRTRCLAAIEQLEEYLAFKAAAAN